VPTIYLIALRIGGAVAGSLGWYWGLPQLARQAADARTRDHIEATYRAPLQGLSTGQARAVYDWARAQHA
jgi:hypothetical protein